MGALKGLGTAVDAVVSCDLSALSVEQLQDAFTQVAPQAQREAAEAADGGGDCSDSSRVAVLLLIATTEGRSSCRAEEAAAQRSPGRVTPSAEIRRLTTC